MKRRTMSVVYIEEKQKNTRGDETQRLDCMAMLLAQMKMIYIYTMKSEANYIVPSRTRQSDIGKISASLVIYISVGYSEFFLFLQPASTYSCQILLLDTPSLIFLAHSIFH